jgi:hypothetical protein
MPYNPGFKKISNPGLTTKMMTLSSLILSKQELRKQEKQEKKRKRRSVEEMEEDRQPNAK